MIYKNKDIKAEINEQGVDIGNIDANFYTKDLGTASIRISINWKGSVLDLSQTTLKPKLDLFCEDGSIFANEPIEIVSPVNGLIQYNISKDVIKHVGYVTGKLFLINDAESIHVVTFRFNISDSGIDSVVTKEVSVTLVDDTVRRIIKENAIQLLGDDFESRLNTDVIEHLNSNPDLFKGAKGDAGETGATGPKGEKGERGEQGIQGEPGNIIAINPSRYGASPSAEWTVNKTAIQKAIDESGLKGGGTVTLEPGEYNVKGLELGSNVTIEGDGVVLKNPDGVAPDIIKTKTFNTKATVEDDRKTLTLQSTTNLENGAVLAIRGAGGMHYSQKTTLSEAVDNQQTTGIKLANSYGFVASGHMIVENEIIGYTGIQNNELTGVTRGMFGTLSNNHSQGVEIGIATRFYSEVVKVNDNKVVLNDTIPMQLSQTDVTYGVVNPRIRNLKFNGNRLTGGAPSEVHPIKFELSRFGLIEDVTVQNGESGIMARNGNYDLHIEKPVFIDCSVVEKTFGSGGWLFRANKRCKYSNVTAIGDMWTGIYFDDRTSVGLEWDAPNYDCVLDGLYTKQNRLSDNLGVAVVGGVRNVVKNCKISGPRTGFSCTSNSQGLGYEAYNGKDNVFQDIQIDNVYQPNIIKAQRTKLYNVTYDEATTSFKKFVDSMPDSLYVYCGGYSPKITYDDGTYNAPSYSFAKDPTTGFYRITDGAIQFVSQGVATVRMINSGIMMQEGKDLALGAINGTRIGTSPRQKLSFYGATPTTQPSSIIPITAASTSQEEIANKLNDVISALKVLGLISND